MKIFALVILMLCPALYAAPGEWTPDAKIISSIIIDNNNSGLVLLVLDGGVPAEFIPNDCKDSNYNTIDLSTEKGKAMYSLALSAYLAEKPVKLALSCIGSRPLITHMWI